MKSYLSHRTKCVKIRNTSKHGNPQEDIELLAWCPAESVLPHGKKVRL